MKSGQSKPKVIKKLNKNRAIWIENLKDLAKDNYELFRHTGNEKYLKEAKENKEEINKLCAEQERRLKEELWRC